jgi:hypothetical protein
MTTEDLPRFANQIALLSLNYHKEITKEFAKYLFQSLHNYTIEQVEIAMNKHRTESNRLPTLSDIVENIKSIPKPRVYL